MLGPVFAIKMKPVSRMSQLKKREEPRAEWNTITAIQAEVDKAWV